MESNYLPLSVLKEISKISQNSHVRARAGVILDYSCSLE